MLFVISMNDVYVPSLKTSFYLYEVLIMYFVQPLIYIM
jgi:hypothetical protein